MSSELEPSEELAQATRMPRSLCSFVLRITAGDREASRAVLERVATEIPGWSRLPQGALWQQVSKLAGRAPARPSTVAAQVLEPAGDDVDLDVDIELVEGGDDARTRAVADANEALAAGRLEFRSATPLDQLTLTCPICHTLRRYPEDVTPPPSCPTCAGALIVTRAAGEEAGEDRDAYCEAFNGRVVEHIRQNLDASFDPGDVQEVSPERAPEPLAVTDPDAALPMGSLEPLPSFENTEAMSRPSIDELLGTPLNESAPPPVADLFSGEVTAPELAASPPAGDEPLFPESTGGDEALFPNGEAASGADEALFGSSEPAPSGSDEALFPSSEASPGSDESFFDGLEAAPSGSDELLLGAPEPDAEAEPESELQRAVLDADDWRSVLAGMPFELEALMAVRRRAGRDAERDLAAEWPKRIQVGSADAFTVRGDCPRCAQSWTSLPDAPLNRCPTCESALAMHTALGGDIDEPALSYQSAYNEAMQAALRAINPAFSWHLVAEAPGSVHARLGRAADVAPAVAAVAYDVSAGDEAATLELLDWLGPKVPREGSDEELREAALGALAEIGAEPDEEEVRGRRAAERLLQQGQLARHVEIGPHHACPSCLQRWPTEGAPPGSCPQCGGPLVQERDLMGELGLSTSGADALNARMERHIRSAIAPGFEWSQVKGP